MSLIDILSAESGITFKKFNDVFQHVVIQLKKDMMMAGFESDKLIESDPDEFINSLASILEDVYRTAPERLRILLYRVDVPEEKITELFANESGESEMALKLTGLIVLRELQKVINRKKYEGD